MSGIVVGAAGLALSGVQFANSQKEKKEAKEAIENFNQQELTNPFENLSISTLKADQQTDANLSSQASSIDALQRAGSREVLGGIPRLNENNILLQNLISQDIARQEEEREKLIAQGEQRIQNVRENRELGALQGFGQQLQSARQDQASAIGNAASSALSIASSFDNSNLSFGNKQDKTPEVFKAQVSPVGIAPINTTPATANGLDSIFKVDDFAFSDFNFNN